MEEKRAGSPVRALLLGATALAVCTPAVFAGSKHIDTVASDDGISRPDYYRYLNMAFPAQYVRPQQSDAARRAFRALSSTAVGAPWTLATPTTNSVPASSTYTDRATTVSGRVTALALTPGCTDDDYGPCRAFLGAAGGGIWIGEHPFDGPIEWKSASEGLETNAIGSVVVDWRSHGRVVYAGSGEQNSSGDSEAGLGLYKSMDGGATWAVLPASVPLANGLSVASIAIDPRDSNHLYFGTATALHGAAAAANASIPPNTANLGLYESRDGGYSFRQLLSTAPGNSFSGSVMEVVLDPNDLDAIYIEVLGSGIERSSAKLDGDAGFRPIFVSGAPDSAFPPPRVNDGYNRSTFAVAKVGSATRLYVGDANDYDGTSGLYRVDDVHVPVTRLTAGGLNVGWKVLSSPTPGTPGWGSYGFCEGQCWYDIYVASPPGHPDTVWFGGSMNYDELFSSSSPSNGRAVMRSTDAGVHFTDMTNDSRTPALGMHPDQHAIAFNPQRVDQVLAGSDGGVVRTSGVLVSAAATCAGRGLAGADLADCQAWLSAIPTRIDPVNAGLADLQFQSVSLDPRDPFNVWMGGTQDNGTWAFGSPESSFFETINGDGGQSGFDAASSNVRVHTYYDATPDINFHGADALGWDWIADPLYLSGEASEFYIPLITDPVRGGSIFAGLQSIWRTQDSGGAPSYLDLHCNEVTGDFSVTCGDWVALGAGPMTSSTFGANRTGGEVVAVARSTGDTGTLWAATTRGRIFVAHNANVADPTAVAFTEIDSLSASPGRVSSDIVVDPNNGNHAWVAYTGYGSNTPTLPGHVYEVLVAHAGVARFTDISYNLGDMPITALVRDERSGDLYAGTDFGVLVLARGAKHWQAMNRDLPPAAVYHLAISQSEGLLYAATHGRSVWRTRIH